jgi:uncharacterized membrane protein
MSRTNRTAQETEVVLMPAAGSAYRFGWRRMKQFFLDLFLVAIIVGVVLTPLGMINAFDGRETPGGILLRMFALAYWLILVAPIQYGSAYIFLKAVRGDKFEVQDMFAAFQNLMNVVLAHLLVAAIIGLGLVLLIVPGVIFACRLVFVKYLVMDRNMDAVTAVKESWRMTRGHANSIFAMWLLAFFIALAGLICLGVGIIPAIIWIRCAFASMYFAVTKAGEAGPAAIPAADAQSA